MKLIAIFQILILLTSVVIPEGAHRVVRGCVCGDNCQCSSETKQAGACCCGTKSADTTTKTTGNCCQSESLPSKSACCSKPAKTASKKSCCSKTDSDQSSGFPAPSEQATHKSKGGNCLQNKLLPHEPIEDQLHSTCGCTEVILHLTVVLMPRLRPSTVFLDDPLLVVDRLPLVSDSTLTNCLLPEVPPPQNRLSASTTNSFAA